MMSNHPGWSVISPLPSVAAGRSGGPMAIDIAVLQAMYGAVPRNAGDTTYVINGLSLTRWESIWDTGGTDWIEDATGSGVDINLNAADLRVDISGAPDRGSSTRGGTRSPTASSSKTPGAAPATTGFGATTRSTFWRGEQVRTTSPPMADWREPADRGRRRRHIPCRRGGSARHRNRRVGWWVRPRPFICHVHTSRLRRKPEARGLDCYRRHRERSGQRPRRRRSLDRR